METCQECREVLTPDGRRVRLCPLHAQVEGMRTLIADIAKADPLVAYASASVVKRARAILRATEARGTP